MLVNLTINLNWANRNLISKSILFLDKKLILNEFQILDSLSADMGKSYKRKSAKKTDKKLKTYIKQNKFRIQWVEIRLLKMQRQRKNRMWNLRPKGESNSAKSNETQKKQSAKEKPAKKENEVSEKNISFMKLLLDSENINYIQIVLKCATSHNPSVRFTSNAHVAEYRNSA